MPASDLPLGLARRTSAVKPVSPATMPAIDTCGPHASAIPSPSRSSCPGFGCVGQLSHASPTPSPLLSAWSGLATAGQLSQASPTPSPSLSAWSGLLAFGQLSQPTPTPPPMPSPSGSLPPTEATTLANGLAHVSRSVQLGLAFSGKPSNRQVVAGAPAVDTVTRTNASTKLPPPLPTSTRKSLQLAPSKRASVAASVKETTSGSVLQTQSCDDGTVARRTSFRKRSKVWVPAPPQSAWLMAKVM